MPVLSTVELVREVASSSLRTIDDLLLWRAVRLLCGGSHRRRAVLSIIAGSVTTVNIMRVSTPGILDIKLEVILACFMGHTSRVTFVILPARLRILYLDKVIGATFCPIRKSVRTSFLARHKDR